MLIKSFYKGLAAFTPPRDELALFVKRNSLGGIMMNTDSFTDEQMLGLINATILGETEHALEDFTGGSVQVTTTHNNKITNYKVLLFFGYNDKRNPITYSEEISKEEYFIWSKALMLKVESLKVDNVGCSFDKLNSRMNKGIGKEVIGIGKGRTTSLRTSYEPKTKTFSFSLKQQTAVENLSKEYLSNLKAYIEESNKSLSYEDFIEGLEAKGNKYKNFKSAYNTWAKNNEKWSHATKGQEVVRYG